VSHAAHVTHADYSKHTWSTEREKDLPELFQPRDLLIASEKPFRKMSKRFFDSAISLSTLPLSVLEIHQF
jgi:hypothetical protein